MNENLTPDELYEHQFALFAALIKHDPCRSWRSLKHHDGSSVKDGWFIAGMLLGEHNEKQITYHLPIKLWSILEGVPVIERSFKWDGHTSSDVIERLKDWTRGSTINYCYPIWRGD